MSLILLYLENFAVKKPSITSLSAITIILFTIGFVPYLTQDAFAQTDEDDTLGIDSISDVEETSVTICHYPPGNPDNSQTISVGTSAVTTHLDHGDDIGACVDVLPDEPKPEPMDEPTETHCYGATIELDQEQYFLSDYYYVTVVAPNKNHNSDAVERVPGTYWDVGKSKIAVAWEETGLDTGIFTNTGVNERLSPNQVSKRVESAPAQFKVSYYDACSGKWIEDVAEILPDDGLVVEPEPIKTSCYNGATIRFDQDEYVLSDYYYVTVVSPDENRDPNTVETASVLFWAEGMNKGEGTLEETGLDTGIFTNTGVNDHLSPNQVSKHVKSTPAYFLMSYYDACSGNTVQDHAKVYSDDPELIEVPMGTDVVIPLGASVPGCEADTYGCYFPYRETIMVGKTVVWFNQDSEWHTVTSGTPEDGSDGLFDSGKIESGQTFEHTFTLPGIYPYFDMVHPWAKGEIRVLGSITSSSDTTPPQVIVPSDIILDESTGDYVTLEYDVKAIDDVDGVITPTCDFESGFVFRTSEDRGDTIPRLLVQCTATDSAGNTGSDSFMVTFVSTPDTTPPVVITSGDMTINAGTDDYVTLEYFVKAIDEVDGLMTPRCDVGSGTVISVVSVEQLLVTCTATDSAGNTGSGNLMVTITSISDTSISDTSISDTSSPQVIVPSDIILNGSTDEYVTLEYYAKAFDDVDGVITPTCDVGSGTVIENSIEQLLVTCTATDSAGNTGSNSFMVTITSISDTTPPVVITSGDMTIERGTDYYVKFEYDVYAFDDVDGVITPTCDRENGSLVAVDYLPDFFLFTCTATDSAGNTGTSRSDTTPTPEPVIEPTPELVIEVTEEAEHEYSQTQSKVKSLDSKILREQSQYDEYYKQYQYYEGKTLSSSDEQKFQRVIEKLNSQNEKVISLIDERNIVVLESDDPSELIVENKNLREELERQGEQIDELNEEVDLLKQIIQSIQGIFGSVFD